MARRPRFLGISWLHRQQYRVHSFIAVLKEISPEAVVVALYFIFMQKRRNNFQARRTHFADQKPGQERLILHRDRGNMRARAIVSVVYFQPVLPRFLAFLFAR